MNVMNVPATADALQHERTPGPDRPVLVVEDDPATRALLGDLLVDAGYAVALVADGAAALHYLFTHASPCCILLDLRLPVVSGITLRRALQRDAQLAGIPVIVVSAHLPDARVRVELAATAYLEKPFTVEQVLALVRDMSGTAR
jgi:CheY-like chemotaxis protein